MTKKTLTLATTLLVAAQGASVQAQEQVTQAEPSTPETTQVTQAEVTTITTKANQAKAAVKDQENLVKEASHKHQEATVLLADDEQTLKQAEETLAQATPEAIASLDSDIVSAKAELVTQTGVVRQAEVLKLEAQQAVSDQEVVVLEKNRELTQSQQDVSDAQKAVDLAQANLDGTGAKEVQEELENAQQEVALKTDQLKATQTAVFDAERSDQERQTLIASKEIEATRLSDALTKDKQALAQSVLQTQSAQEELAKATAALSIATADYEGLNTITLLPDYVSNLKAYAEGTYTSAQALDAERRLKALNAQQLALNTYKPNLKDDQTPLDPRQLPQKVRQELTHFAVDLVNQIRRQMGTPEVSAHRQVIDLAERIANRYETDHWDWNKTITVNTHHKEAIKEEAAAMGLRSSSHYENIHTIGTMYQPITTLTLSDLKAKVHQAIINFMFNGQEYFHAMSVSATPGYGQPSRYLGLDFSNRSDAFSIHLIGVSETAIEDRGRFHRTAILAPENTSAQVTATYQAAQARRETASAQAQKAQTAQTVAELALKSSQDQFDQVHQALSLLKAKPLDLSSAKFSLNQAQSQLTQATNRLTKAQEAKANLTADQVTKSRLLEETKQILDQAQGKLADHQAALQLETGRLHERQEALVEASHQLDLARAKEQDLADKVTALGHQRQSLLEAPERLKEIKIKWAMTTALVNERHDTLKEALAKLESLSETSDKLEAQRLAVETAYQAYLASQDLHQEPQTSDEAVLKKYETGSQNNKTGLAKAPAPELAKHVAIMDQETQAHQPLIHQSVPSYGQALNQVTPVYGHNTLTAPKTLPKTGSQSAMALVLSGLMSVFVALGLVKKPRH